VCQRPPGNNQSVGLRLSPRQYSRKAFNNVGESNEKERIMLRRWPGPAFVGAQLKSTFSLVRRVSERVEPG
jgi:hypothetical protein